MIYKFSILLFFILTTSFVSDHENWQIILEKVHFKKVIDKHSIPNRILSSINIENIHEIANPNEQWNASCLNLELPRQQLNWAMH